MSDKRIIELDVTDVVEADDFLAIDSVSGKTRRIKPIRIGATYEIEDGDHSFTLVGSNGYSHTVDIPYDSVSMTQAEYDALTPAQKADGTARFITDGESDVESELWSKVGRQTLDTEAQVLSNAVNELKGDIDTNTDNISTNIEAISQLQSSIDSFSTWKTWQPQLYDYTTYKRDFSANGDYRYLEMGSLVIAFINVNNQDYSDISTMLQIRNLPMVTVLSGICYFAGNATAGADKVVQMLGSTNHLYPRPNITSAYFSNPSSSGWTSILIFGAK